MKDKIIDYDDLKVKHISGEYVNLPSAPEPDDILYWCKSKKKKIFTTDDMTKTFGEEKMEQITKSLEFLDFNNYLKTIDKTERIDGKSKHWFFHPESDSYGLMTWDEYNDEENNNYTCQLDYLGVATKEDETEAEELHEMMKKGDTPYDGSVIITKYEMIKDGL